MEKKASKTDLLKKFAAPNLIVILAGAALAIAGIILLIRGKFLTGGIVAGVGLLVFAGGVGMAALLVYAVDKSARARGKAISNDTYFIQDDWFVSFTEAGAEIVNVSEPEAERPCMPYSEVNSWTFFSYRRPGAKGKLTYTLKFPIDYLPLTMREVDRARPFVYLDIREPHFAETVKTFSVPHVVKSAQLTAKPVKVADYGYIAVYDSGVYLTNLWRGEKTRFLPWEDVEKIFHSEEENELIFSCGYELVHARFHPAFWRDLEANFPDKIGSLTENGVPMSEEE